MCRIYTEERNSELHGGGGKKWVVCVWGGGQGRDPLHRRGLQPFYIGGVLQPF
jgi:hypothetical protein